MEKTLHEIRHFCIKFFLVIISMAASTQLTFTCPKSAIETLGESVKYVKS